MPQAMPKLNGTQDQFNNEVAADDYIFNPTQNWTVGHDRYPVWNSILHHVASSHPKVLEVGCWEGRSGVFFLENVVKDQGDLTCIDHFDLLRTPEGRERHRRIQHNFDVAGGKYRIFSEYSVPGLYHLLLEALSSPDPGYDWIYIDGSHEGDDTCLDGELAWRLAKKGAVFVFDDYRWVREPDTSRHHPRRGIDAFLQLHKGEYTILSGTEEDQYQMILLKESPLRVGFTAEGYESEDRDEMMQTVNMVVAVNAANVADAIKTMENIASATSVNTSFFIASCGISDVEKNSILQSIVIYPTATVVFTDLSSSTLAHEMGLEYAKIDLMNLLPVKRVLFVEAGVLVCSPVEDIWATDMQGRSIAAIRDDIFPMGHEDVREGPYFKTSLLLVDLPKVQEKRESLIRKARRFKNSRFPLKDALNVHFEYDWRHLDPEWVVQSSSNGSKVRGTN